MRSRATIVLLLVVGAAFGWGACGSSTTVSSSAGGRGGAGEGGSLPEPEDPCAVTWDQATCCGRDGCVFLYGQGCVSDDRLCHFQGCDEMTPTETPCADGYECVLSTGDNSPHDCVGGEARLATRGVCVWVDR